MEQGELLKRLKNKTQADKFVSYHLHLENAFGCEQTPRHSNCFIVSSSIIYLNDGCLIMHNILQNTKRFLYRLQPQQTITAVNCNQSLEFIIVVGIKTPSSAMVLLYDSRDGCTLKHFLPINHIVSDLYFFSTNQFAAIVKSQKSSYIFVKRFFRGSSLSFSETKQPLKRNIDSDIQKIAGEYQGILFMLSNDNRVVSFCIDDDTVKTQRLHIDGLVDFIVYTNQQIIVLTRTSVIFYQNYAVKQQINLKQTIQGDFECFCMLKLTKRFLLGHKNSISVSVFSFDGLQMKFTQTFRTKQRIRGGVYSMHGSFQQMNIGITMFLTDKTDELNIQKGKPLPKDVYLQNMVFGLTSINTEKIISPFHRIFKNEMEYGDITSITGSMTPECYILTHKSLTSYNFSVGLKAQYKYCFVDHPLNLCFHPLGYQLVCFFKDYFKVYYRLDHQLLQIKKQCKVASTGSFSSRGLLAISTCNKSHYEIQLYDISRLCSYKTMTCFVSKTPISKINWIHEDTQLEVYCNNNQFAVIDIYQDQKVFEYSEKKNVKMIEYDCINQMLVVCYQDSSIKVFVAQEQTNQLTSCISHFDFQNQTVKSLHIDKNIGLIVFGMSNGSVKWCQWPWTEVDSKEIHKTIFQVVVSCSPVVKLFMTINSKYTIVVCENNSVTILRTKKKKNGKLLNYQIDIQFSSFQDIKLFQNNIVSLMKEKIKNLQQKKQSCNNQLQQLRSYWQMKEKQELQRIENYNISLQEQQQYNLLKQIDKNKKRKSEIIKNLTQLNETKYSAEVKIKDQQQKEMSRIYGQIDRLKKYKQQLQSKINKEYQEAQSQYQKSLESIRRDFQVQISQKKVGLSSLKTKIQERKMVGQIVSQQTKEERQELKMIHQAIMNKQQIDIKKIIIQWRAKISKLRRQNQRFDARRQFLETKKKHICLQLQFQQEQNQQLSGFKSYLETNLNKIQKTTHNYEQTLNTLTTKNNHLFNFRKVYINLQNSLNQQIKTLEQYSRSLSNNIKKMNQELVDVLLKTRGLTDKSNAIQVSIQDGKKQLSKYQKPRIIINSFCNDIHQQLNTFARKDNKHKISDVYQFFFKNVQYINRLAQSSSFSKMSDETLLKDKQAQKFKKIKQNLIDKKQYFQNCVQLFKHQHKSLDKSLSSAFNKLQNHNSRLITECNGLKEQLQKKSKTLNQMFTTLKTIDCLNVDLIRDPYFSYEYQDSNTKKDKDLQEWFPQIDDNNTTVNNRHLVRTSQSHTRNRKKKANTNTRQSQNDESYFSGKRLLSVRRIMTAHQNNRDRYNQVKQLKDMEQVESTIPSKPATNQGSRKLTQWRSKSKRMDKFQDKDNKSSVTGFSIFS